MIETRIGDVLPWQARAPLFTPWASALDGFGNRRKPLLFPLLCAPLREEAATVHLKEHGIKAIYPSYKRTVTVRGRKMTRTTILLPGYLFAEIHGTPNWTRILDRENPARLIRDVIRLSDGTPACIREGELATIRRIVAEEEQRLAEEKAAAELAAKRARDPVRPGDMVRLPSIIGMDGEVVEVIGKGGFRVRLTLLGSTREIEVMGDVEKVA